MLDGTMKTLASRKTILYTSGVTNRTVDGLYVLFIDYDDVDLAIVEQDVAALQASFTIGTSLILSSSTEHLTPTGEMYGNYHVVSFTKHAYGEILRMLENARCDDLFRKTRNKRKRVWVLRVAEKKDKDKKVIKPAPRIIQIITAPSTREISSAHLNFYSKLVGRKIKVYGKKDGHRELEFVNYATR